VILTSTAILTLLLAVGLFFFIKASVKDRTERLRLTTNESETELLPRLEHYFTDRAYRLKTVNPDTNVVTFEGFVSPSWFLAIFLSLLAAAGSLCLSLVLATIFPHIGYLFLLPILVSPLAGWFYWQQAGRLEQISLSVEPASSNAANEMTAIEIVGHRDELAIFQSELKLSVHEGIK
jgi:Cofactor assembly of complex C subunit B